MTTSSTIFSSTASISHAWNVRKFELDDVRRQAIERRERSILSAVSYGIPTTRHEEWKYTSLRPLIAGNFDLAKATQNHEYHLDQFLVDHVQNKLVDQAIPIVFVDGKLDLSWPGSNALDPDFFRTLLDVELEEDDTWWHFWQSAPGMDSLFAHLTAGLAHDGIAIRLNKNQVLQRPIHIFHISTKDRLDEAKLNRVLIQLGEGAKLRVYEQFIRVAGNTENAAKLTWSSCLTQFKLSPISDCGYYRIIDAPDSFHTGTITVELEQGSRLETFSLVAGVRFARVNLDVKYHAQDAECVLNGLYLVQGNEHVDHHTCVTHAVGLCRTHQFYKGILKDQARAVFSGKIFIKKDAQGSEAYQTNKNLLLSKEAEVDAKPQLEIDANDVKASHGAAIGTIDPAELFYLQSRCIGREEATAMLCRGFADDVVNRTNDVQAQKYLSTMVAHWFLQNFETKDLIDQSLSDLNNG